MGKDEIERRPASENPWYVLMTIAGEQGEEFDEALHARNRRFWHGWVGKEALKDFPIKDNVAKWNDFDNFSEEEKREWNAAVNSRCSEEIPPNRQSVDLSREIFASALYLDGYIFPHKVHLTSSKFKSDLSISGCRFGSDVNLNHASIHGDLICNKSIFCGKLDAERCEMGGFANFAECSFKTSLWMNWASFKGPFIFEKCCVAEGANFANIKYFASAVLERSEFKEYCVFSNSIFNKDVRFENCLFSGVFWFDRSQICGELDAVGSSFLGPTTFAGACFASSVPKFFQCSLHEDTDWLDVIWPFPRVDPASSYQARRRYERLKLLMDGQKKTHDEQMFHRMELRCREVEEGFPRNVPSRVYGLVSEYGWSFVRPGIALALVVMLGWFVLGPLLCWGGGTAAEVSACSFRGLYVSVSNTFGFLGLWRLIPDGVEAVLQQSVLAMVVKVVQAVLGPVFLFFVLLALRNRYRMR